MQSRAGSKPVGRLRQLAWLALAFLFVQAAPIPSAFAIDYTVTKTRRHERRYLRQRLLAA